jgi:homoserine/homoserine lactone efflux protein
MTWATWGWFLLTEVLLDLSPGPAVLAVTGTALRFGLRRSLLTTAGILTANATFFALSAAGLGAMLLASHRLFLVIKWVGAVYLVYLGAAALLGRGHAASDQSDPAEHARDTVSAWSTWRNGLILQAANPKAILFFTALLPQFIHSNAPVWPQILVLGLTSVVVESAVLGSYGFAAARASRIASSLRARQVLDRASGVMLIGAGVGVALAGE